MAESQKRSYPKGKTYASYTGARYVSSQDRQQMPTRMASASELDQILASAEGQAAADAAELRVAEEAEHKQSMWDYYATQALDAYERGLAERKFQNLSNYGSGSDASRRRFSRWKPLIKRPVP